MKKIGRWFCNNVRMMTHLLFGLYLMNGFVYALNGTEVLAEGDARSGLSIRINNTQHISILKKIYSQDPEFGSRFVLGFPTYSYNPNILDKPLEEWWSDLNKVSDPNGRITNYYVEKVVYEIDQGYFMSSIEIKEGISLSFVDNSLQKMYSELEGYDIINILFNGRITTNIRNFKKITEIFAEVSGLKGVIALVIIIFLGQYFQFKYHENLLNNINRFKESFPKKKIVDEAKSPEQEPLEKNDKRNKEIRISYFSFVFEKLKRMLMKSERKNQYLAHKKPELDFLEKEVEKIEEQFDVVNLTYKLNNYEALLNENKALIQTLMLQNENLQDRISKLEVLFHEKEPK